ncbi:MAG: MmcQ/YjbR family DNA-binding protein [Bacteroidia bacterium]|nr:MmcQ/YjbR family DNA-binding protein [Bacteroidia bacterium]
MDIETLRNFCITLPCVTEDIKWDNDLCFCIGGKMFCIASLDPPFKLAIKVEKEKFAELIQISGISPAPYLARYNWVSIQMDAHLGQQEQLELVKKSYQLVLEKLGKQERMKVENAS